ncbi:UDP-N-acetylenolpyruvoylglucosamine reductase [Candidatus Peregrinibacteria bacterium CG10_big_fil_rev_8_21_14_0_10_55_24]|nr:MAG: UDP-N-acetylenolpyruvoylglucosamine reductase [Candidatus Peregrinibacteria bacterium CG10_big_fil_rev_8_21_14_0_10_55_24]
MQIREYESLKPKTTMRIGGNARYFAELQTQKDVEDAQQFAEDHHLPLVVLGSGSNTIFAEGTIEAVVVRVTAAAMHGKGERITVEAGKNLAMLIAELAKRGRDLSPLAGIPGTLGGAIVGNAGQGPDGIWIDTFVEKITCFEEGTWKTYAKQECVFAYRESRFKHASCIVWSAELVVPQGEPQHVEQQVKKLLERRMETQPHLKTAGSCFKALSDGTPAWKLIERAGLRGLCVGGITVSEKHANFLTNTNAASFLNAVTAVRTVQGKIPELQGNVEMRFIGTDGKPLF